MKNSSSGPTLSTLQRQREALVKKREVERQLTDSKAVEEAAKAVQYWKDGLARIEGSTTIAILEEQLKKARENHERSLRYHSERLKAAEVALKNATEGESKKTKKLSAEIEMLDKEIAFKKAEETGDMTELRNLVKMPPTNSSIPTPAPAPPPPPPPVQPPPAEDMPSIPKEVLRSEDDTEALLKAARLKARQEDAVISSIFGSVKVITSSQVKKQPKKATSASEV